jgi:hypothetical protein
VSKPSRIRSIARRIRRKWADYFPAFPRIPSSRKVAAWWRGLDLPAFPRIPSRRRIANTWRRFREEFESHSFRPIASTRKAGAWERERYAPPLPPVPSPTKFADWVRARPRRRTFLLRCLAAAVVLAVLRFSGPPVFHRVKEWQARRLAAQAFVLIDHRQWTEAAKKVRDAFQLRQSEPQVWRANARLLSRTGRGTPAVEWWEKIEQGQPLSLDDRRDYAAAALSASELGLAAEQVRLILSQQKTPLPTDLLLVGQLAALHGDNSAAMDNAKRAMADKRLTPRELLGANLLMLTASTRDSPSFVEASTHLVQLARNRPDSVSLEALTVLARQISATPPGNASDQPLSIPLPQFSAENISALEIADRLERHPDAQPYHKMLALEMRARAEPTHEGT